MGRDTRVDPSWIVVPLMLSLIAACAWSGVVLLTHDPARSHDPAGDGGITNTAAHASGGLSTEPSQAPTPPPVADCWDGSTAVAVADCPLPTGVRGLEHVFPSFHPSQCNDVRAQHPELAHPQMWECFGTVLDQPVTVTYDIVDGVARAQDYYDRAYVEGYRELRRDAQGVPQRYQWTGDDGYPARITSLYLGFPYAVSVYAPTAEVAHETWRTVVRLRAATTLLGRMRAAG